MSVFSNREEFKELDDPVYLLFYIEENEEVLFDGDGDEVLSDIVLQNPLDFETNQLEEYMAFVSRARYRMKLHPDQKSITQTALEEFPVGKEFDDFRVFVVERDSKSQSPVQNRSTTPFQSPTNGIDQPDVVILFNEYSFQPWARARVVWYKEKRRNSQVALAGVEVVELL